MSRNKHIPPAAVTTIIFDWHGVLELSTFEDFAQQLPFSADPVLQEQQHQQLLDLKEPFQRGKLSHRGFWTQLQTILELDDKSVKKLLSQQKLELNDSLFEWR